MEFSGINALLRPIVSFQKAYKAYTLFENIWNLVRRKLCRLAIIGQRELQLDNNEGRK
jgi:hypothetical protein